MRIVILGRKKLNPPRVEQYATKDDADLSFETLLQVQLLPHSNERISSLWRNNRCLQLQLLRAALVNNSFAEVAHPSSELLEFARPLLQKG